MSFTLLEGAIAILLVWIAWRIGCILAPWIIRRFKGAHPAERPTPERKEKPRNTIDI